METLNAAFDYIQQHYTENVSLDALASVAYLSPKYFSSLFKRCTGQTVTEYIQKLRVYISGNDVWEKSDILKVFDPEAGNNVGRNYYPFFRTWSFGVNVTL